MVVVVSGTGVGSGVGVEVDSVVVVDASLVSLVGSVSSEGVGSGVGTAFWTMSVKILPSIVKSFMAVILIA